MTTIESSSALDPFSCYEIQRKTQHAADFPLQPVQRVTDNIQRECTAVAQKTLELQNAAA